MLANNVLAREGNAAEKPQVFSLQVFTESIRGILKGLTLFGRVHVTVELKACADLNVCLPSHALTQIVLNLGSNAIKYSDAEGNVEVQISRTDNNMLRIRVSDEGLGLTPEFVQNGLFRLHSRERKNSASGSGLGLYITKKLVDEMNGTIKVKPRTKGTCFIVEIPLDNTLKIENAEETDAPPAFVAYYNSNNNNNDKNKYNNFDSFSHLNHTDDNGETTEEEDDHHQKKYLEGQVECLIVDDTAMNISVMRNMLKRVTAAKISTADHGFDAIAHVAQWGKKSKRGGAEEGEMVVFLDREMPQMKGEALVPILRLLEAKVFYF
jgi:anti-sigma regulatory factor (Ser/Thr protein kinase)/CheY-like chemotaxis protein